MARTRDSFLKREKERARQQRQRDKAAQRVEAKERRAAAGPRIEGEDPDIAGIRPGPQPLPEEWRHADQRRSPDGDSTE